MPARAGHTILLTLAIIAFVQATLSAAEEAEESKRLLRSPGGVLGSSSIFPGMVLPNGMPNCTFYNLRRYRGDRLSTKVYYGITFYNELDVLEVLLHEVGFVVDFIVIVESVRTFTFKRKPLTFAAHQHEERFAPFLHKIRHIVLDDADLATCTNCSTDPWAVEFFQRDQIKRGMWDMEDEDVAVFGDVDEIIPGHMANMMRTCRWVNSDHQPLRFTLGLFYYNFRCRMNVRWFQPTAAEGHIARHISFADLREYYGEMQSYRATGEHPALYGWHISFFGTVSSMQQKLSSYSHQELNTPKINEAHILSRRVEMCWDFANRRDIFAYNFVANEYRIIPQYVLENAERFRSWLPRAAPPPPDLMPFSQHESDRAVLTVMRPIDKQVLPAGKIEIDVLTAQMPGTTVRIFLGKDLLSQFFYGSSYGSLHLNPGKYTLTFKIVDLLWETVLQTQEISFRVEPDSYDFASNNNHIFSQERLAQIDAIRVDERVTNFRDPMEMDQLPNPYTTPQSGGYNQSASVRAKTFFQATADT